MVAAPPDSKTPIVKFDKVSKSYDSSGTEQVLALKDISFTIHDEEAGEFVALLGPSGCGKSTILNMISGLLMPSLGTVDVMGKPVVGPTADAVTVQQAYTCFPWKSVLGNVTFGLEIIGVDASEREDRAMDYIKKVGLADRAKAFPKELSGGMQQRVALARALALRRPVLLMDEPFGALDAQTRDEMQQLLMEIWAEEKNTIFFITHDVNEAVLLADRIIVLSRRPSTVIFDVPVSFPRPRGVEFKSNEKFVGLVDNILRMLRTGSHVPA